MPRQARKPSSSGYLHVIVRGIGKQSLFEDTEDYLFFLGAMERFARETQITVCAYCLMDNHVHMLLKDSSGKLALMMKKLGVSYSGYFNRKYDRVGHLFQDRYLSEAVEDDAYLLAVFRYILRNPEKAGICRVEEYRWSSYRAYADRNNFAETEILESLIGNWEQYVAFINEFDDTQCLEFEPIRHNDEWAREIIRRELNSESGTILQQMDHASRDEALRKLKALGISVRQLERLTGINRGVVQKA